MPHGNRTRHPCQIPQPGEPESKRLPWRLLRAAVPPVRSPGTWGFVHTLGCPQLLQEADPGRNLYGKSLSFPPVSASHTLKDNIAAEERESWYFSSEPIQTQIGKEEKKKKSVQGKVLISDSSLTGSFCVAGILIQTKPQLAREGAPLTCQTQTQPDTPR